MRQRDQIISRQILNALYRHDLDQHHQPMASTSISKAERSYIQAGILANPPSRADGRSIYDFRSIALETGVAPLANGSARLSIGRNPHDGSGGTEILAATKLEVESIEPGGSGVDGGRISCTVSWYVLPAARKSASNIPARKVALPQHTRTSLGPRLTTSHMT